MGFKNLKEIVDAEESGAYRFTTFRKTVSNAPSSGVWFDLSMIPGNPVPNYYAASPMTSVALRQSTDGGIFHGANVSPLGKYLRKSSIMISAGVGLPIPFMLLDYLLYYPFIDEGSTDEQILNNTVSLPRYSDGKGVQIMCVSVAARTGGQSFTVKYTNQDGVSGRISKVVFENIASLNGSIITSLSNSTVSNTVFIPLQNGDTGVRYIESVTMNGTDVGLFTLVLVKPITQFTLFEQTAPAEVDYFLDKGLSLPKIEDDAYLNLICIPQSGLTGVTFIGEFKFILN